MPYELELVFKNPVPVPPRPGPEHHEERPVKGPHESTKEYQARLDKWALRQPTI